MRHSANFCYRKFRQVLSILVCCALLAGCTSQTSRELASPIESQLMAEIALQRGEYLVAVQEYLAMAARSDDAEFARRATELAYEYGFLAHAVAGAERWVELQPQDTSAHAYLGRLNVKRNLPVEAFRSLDLSLGPVAGRDDRDYYFLSSELIELASPFRGLAVFELFNQAYPQNIAIVSSVASLANMVGEHELAIESAREALLLAPESAITRVWLARYLLAAGERSSAFEQMAFALEMSPGLDMGLEFVTLLVAAGEKEDAQARMDRMFERYPDEPLLNRQRGILAVEWQDYPLAIQNFSELLLSGWYVDESFWYLGQVAYEQEDYLQAIRYFKRVGEGLWQSNAVNSISRAYLEMGDVNTALTVQRDFLDRYPEKIVPQAMVRAELLASAEMLPEALETIDAALEFDPWNEWFWVYRGNLYDLMNDVEAALGSYREAWKLAPEDPNMMNTLGYSLTVAGRDFDEAYQLISGALERAPENAAIMDSMGWILFKQGDLSTARTWLEQAYAKLPDPEVAAHLGEVMWEQGEKESAREIWFKSLELNPDDRVLNDTIGRFTNE
ncbi:MAG: tetratricopeptide repeat protein [Gammaproteobacteria bacterium]